MKKPPTIAVAATPELLAVLHACDIALKASRMKNKPDPAPLHALIVNLTAIRMATTPLLEPCRADPAG